MLEFARLLNTDAEVVLCFVSYPSQTPDVDVPSVDVPPVSAGVDAGGLMPSLDVDVSAPSASLDVPGELMPVRVFVLRVLAYTVFDSRSWSRDAFESIECGGIHARLRKHTYRHG